MLNSIDSSKQSCNYVVHGAGDELLISAQHHRQPLLINFQASKP
jgi:hypothetical protein